VLLYRVSETSASQRKLARQRSRADGLFVVALALAHCLGRDECPVAVLYFVEARAVCQHPAGFVDVAEASLMKEY
jgi:hypothetical protein